MTARHAARRKGCEATGPPSWKTSSTSVTFFLTCSSGIREAPLRHARCDACSASEAECGGVDQSSADERFGKKSTSLERDTYFVVAEVSHVLRHETSSEIAVGSKCVCRNADYVGMSR